MEFEVVGKHLPTIKDISKSLNLEVNMEVNLLSLGRYKGGAGVILHPIMLVEIREGSKVMAVCFIPDAK